MKVGIFYSAWLDDGRFVAVSRLGYITEFGGVAVGIYRNPNYPEAKQWFAVDLQSGAAFSSGSTAVEAYKAIRAIIPKVLEARETLAYKKHVEEWEALTS